MTRSHLLQLPLCLTASNSKWSKRRQFTEVCKNKDVIFLFSSKFMATLPGPQGVAGPRLGTPAGVRVLVLVLGAAPVPSCPSLTAHGSREMSAPAPSRRRPPWTSAASFWFLALAVRRTPPSPFLELTVRQGAVRTAGAYSPTRLAATLRWGCCSFPHFTDEETAAQRCHRAAHDRRVGKTGAGMPPEASWPRRQSPLNH